VRVEDIARAIQSEGHLLALAFEPFRLRPASASAFAELFLLRYGLLSLRDFRALFVGHFRRERQVLPIHLEPLGERAEANLIVEAHKSVAIAIGARLA
jgi:hypothetical protein